MTISVIIDPTPCHPKTASLAANRHQTLVLPRQAHPLDQQILDVLKAAAEPMGTWELLNSIAKAARPTTRAETRSIRQQALTRINPLLKDGLIKRIGRGALALP